MIYPNPYNKIRKTYKASIDNIYTFTYTYITNIETVMMKIIF